MGYIAIDLGTTNVKVCCYDEALVPLAYESRKVCYDQTPKTTEFDADSYFELVCGCVYECLHKSGGFSENHVIVLTGQAESLVVTDPYFRPLCKAISWLDGRGADECELVEKVFSKQRRYELTGQNTIATNFPLVKIMWFNKHAQQLTGENVRYLMIKDHIAYRLCGVAAGEYSIYNFTYYFDINKRDYCDEMLELAGISRKSLPQLRPPCSQLGKVLPEVAQRLRISKDSIVNCGTLDHFAGMIGTGNTAPGTVSESTGTVMTLAAVAADRSGTEDMIPCHCGPFEDGYIYLPVCESGGISLEWFKNNFATELSFAQLDELAGKSRWEEELIFLPYINGINAPEYSKSAKGIFYGLSMRQGRGELAAAVMQGVALLLDKNVLSLSKACGLPKEIISTGGGAKSDYWCSVKAEVTGLTVAVPDNIEAALFGCAIIGAVSTGKIKDFTEGSKYVNIKKRFVPQAHGRFEKKKELFAELYNKLF